MPANASTTAPHDRSPPAARTTPPVRGEPPIRRRHRPIDAPGRRVRTRSPARPSAASISRRSQSTRSAVVISPRVVAEHRRDPRTGPPGARTASTGAPWPAAAANSCSTARSSNAFERSVRPIGPASRSPSACSSATSWTGEAAARAAPGRAEQIRLTSRARVRARPPGPGSPPARCGSRSRTACARAWRRRRLRRRLVSSENPPAAAACCISCRRFENSSSTASGTSLSSAAPFAPDPTPVRAARRPRLADAPGRDSRRSSPPDTAARHATP